MPSYITSVERIGEERGRLIGIQMGRQEGEATMLMRMLQRRFGVLPMWVREKIAMADSLALEEWGVRFIDAQSLDEVFVDRM